MNIGLRPQLSTCGDDKAVLCVDLASGAAARAVDQPCNFELLVL